jgi:hypothetical protein
MLILGFLALILALGLSSIANAIRDLKVKPEPPAKPEGGR